ncbi:hypothetical protein SBY92_000416 [Candida maltosa Xu316]
MSGKVVDGGFPVSLYQDYQSSLVDGLVSEITEDSINLNSFKQFDELLTHLELPFTSSHPIDEKYLPIPSPDILRVLFTLASRSPSCNWTVSSSLVDSIPASPQQVKSTNNYYEESISKTNLNDRSINIIDKYLDMLSPNSKLYDNLMTFMSDFMDLPIRKTRLKDSLPEKTKDILTIMRESPKKKRGIDKSTETNDDDDDEEVSDSQSEFEEVTKHQDMSIEVNKFQNLPIDTNLGLIGNNMNQSGLNNPAVLFNKDATPTVNIPKWQGIKIFDEHLLSTRLNPKLNDFDLWHLINWAFYCAGKPNDDYDSTYKNCHIIYKTHASTLHQLFRLIEFNLITEFNALFSTQEEEKQGDALAWLFKQSQQRRKLAMDEISQSSTMLLSNLLKQLGYFRTSWYDRLVEFVFNGLTSTNKTIPPTCYEHEKILIKKDDKKIHHKTFIFYNDNMDSMKLRFKITCVVHYWSMVFDPTSPDGIYRPSSQNENSIGPHVLIKEIANKFMYMEYDYWVEFYYSSLLDSDIPLAYRETFLVNLTSNLLNRLTGSTTWDFFLVPRDDKLSPEWRTSNFQLVLNWMKDKELYYGFIEDETYQSFAHFRQTWNKYNFILEWIFAFTLKAIVEVGYEDLIYKEELISRCHEMDILREKIYLHYVKRCKKGNNIPFKLTTEEADALDTIPYKWETFTSIISNIL